MRAISTGFVTEAGVIAANLHYSNRGPQHKLDDTGLLPGLKCTAEAHPDSKKTKKAVLELSRLAFSYKKEMIPVLARLLSGDVAEDWRIVEIGFEGSYFILRIANQDKVVQTATIIGAQLPRTSVELLFKGQDDELTVLLGNGLASCHYASTNMLDEIMLSYPDQNGYPWWVVKNRRETTW